MNVIIKYLSGVLAYGYKSARSKVRVVYIFFILFALGIGVHLTLDRFLVRLVVKYDPMYFFNEDVNWIYDFYAERLLLQSPEMDINRNSLLMVSNYHMNEKKLFEMPLIGGGVGKLLIRGYGYCDQVNGVFALKINKNSNVVLFALKSANGSSPHTVIKYSSARIYYDFWAEPFKFKIDNDKYISYEGWGLDPDKFYRGFQVLPRDFENGFVLNEFTIWYRFKKLFTRFSNFLSGSSLHGAQPPMRKITHLEPLDESELRLYLLARISIINNDYVSALSFLDQMLAEECRGYPCQVAAYLKSKIKMICLQGGANCI